MVNYFLMRLVPVRFWPGVLFPCGTMVERLAGGLGDIGSIPVRGITICLHSITDRTPGYGLGDVGSIPAGGIRRKYDL